LRKTELKKTGQLIRKTMKDMMSGGVQETEAIIILS
jgi:hypothetical protein